MELFKIQENQYKEPSRQQRGVENRVPTQRVWKEPESVTEVEVEH